MENTYKTARITKKIQARKVILIADKKKIFGKIVHYFIKEEFIQQQIVATVL